MSSSPPSDQKSQLLLESQEPPQQRNFFQRTFRSVAPGSLRGTIFILMASAMGPSVTTVPAAILKSGIILGPILLTLGAGFSGWSYYIMFKSAIVTNTTNYYDCMKFFYGRKMAAIAQFFIVLYAFTILVANQIMGCTVWQSMLENFGWENSNSDNAGKIIKLIQAAVALPLCFKTNLSFLRYMTIISCVSQFYFMFLVIIQAKEYRNKFINSPDYPDNNINTQVFDWNLFISYGILMFDYASQTVIYPLKKEMQNPTETRCKKICIRALLLEYICFCAIGFCGYCAFYDYTPAMQFQRVSMHKHDIPMQIYRVALCFIIYTSLPLNLNPGRSGSIILIKGEEAPFSLKINVLITTLFMLASLACAIFYPNILVVLSIIGGIDVCTMGIFFPALLYIAMNKKGWRHPVNILVFTIAATLTIIGYISGVVSVLGKSGVIDIPYMEAKSQKAN